MTGIVLFFAIIISAFSLVALYYILSCISFNQFRVIIKEFPKEGHYANGDFCSLYQYIIQQRYLLDGWRDMKYTSKFTEADKSSKQKHIMEEYNRIINEHSKNNISVIVQSTEMKQPKVEKK